jgi:hypothetical protein
LPPKQNLRPSTKNIEILYGTSWPPLILKKLQRRLYKGDPKPTTTKDICCTLLPKASTRRSFNKKLPKT